MQLLRRSLLQSTACGLGSLALSTLLAEDRHIARAVGPHSTRVASPRAKQVIFLHMVGAPSHLDLFEYKPKLVAMNGRECPRELLEGKRFAFLRGVPKLLGTKYRFHKHGESGIELSELLPHLAHVVDDITLVKTLHTEQINHAPAQLFLQTGFGRFGRPSMGSWVSYGLGSENADLPTFVVLQTGATAGGGNSLWGSGFLPSRYQGTEFRNQGDPVLFLSDPAGMERSTRRAMLDLIGNLNRQQLADLGDPEIATRVEQYELAFRMQTSVPDLMNFADEPQWLLDEYGAQPGKAKFANHCVLARRLVERGVRFVQLMDADWDHHAALSDRLPQKCQEVDQPIAALLRDLKRRGLLDETLVVFGAEFGRTPMLQGAANGRDHHKEAFCVWLAGGGIRGGHVHGQTDELGYSAIENAVHIHDLQATILHCLGIDHRQLTYRYQGRDFRLTDVDGQVIQHIIA